jgi:hypothetical protein
MGRLVRHQISRIQDGAALIASSACASLAESASTNPALGTRLPRENSVPGLSISFFSHKIRGHLPSDVSSIRVT